MSASTPSDNSIERFFRSGLKLGHLRILVALGELRQVTRVAAAFHVTQPAISKQIAEIEEALATPVVRRVGNAIELTRIGRVLVERGREILRQIELARRDVKALASGTAGHVRFGAVVTIPQPLIAHAVELFTRRAPNASFSFVEATLDRLLKMMDEGNLDLALGRNRVTGYLPVMRHESLHHEPFVFVVGTRHPLGGPDTPVAWGDLQDVRWITPMQGSPAFATMVEILAEHGVTLLRPTIESSSLALNLSLLRDGGYVSILPLSLARRYVQRGTMRMLPLPPLGPLGEAILYWREDTTTSTTQLFAECLRESSAELIDATGA
ncbi:bacterial regulatory helix-turn-helix protein, LysR family protein 126 [Achromobacter xylosoxidans A8]|uniref:Bacterial regulatory helix-turn-helix protein, LysR family protein 126 n=1 Tax=Achromobacter xylosoxidans (strain A8) TaxID=762376 RepID=E3HNR7_ACHXA|nr:LysR family transcriptional regulator [Achromobacter xylosoxidans]ADP17106.1 bacterial regulatory helix-turn-helix protein, LysR family protein 126 [Achromobacter xylosoxidans A8]